MKNKILFITSVLLLFSISLFSSEKAGRSNSSSGDSLTVISSPDLYPLALKWVSEFSAVAPEIKISVLKASGTEDFKLNAGSDLGFVSREYFSTLNNESIWKEVVGRDVYVPILNSGNPFMEEIRLQGISADELSRIFAIPDAMNWGSLVDNARDIPVTFYLLNNKTSKAELSEFLAPESSLKTGTLVESGKEIVAAIQKDIYGIGFCKLTDILDLENQQITDNISLLPIDRNGNGKIDYNENIYESLNAFSRGVWIGKYPKALYSSIYTVASSKPSKESEVAFVKWVLTEGQQFITPNGYCDLALNERQSKVDELIVSKVDIATPIKDNANLKWALLIAAAIVLGGFLVDGMLRSLRNKKAVEPVSESAAHSVFNINSVSLLNGLYFDKSHTWAFMEKDGFVKIGIDDFMQHVTGRITQVKMKSPGDKIFKGEPILTIIQKGKQLSLNAPVSGVIKEQNQALSTNAALLNSSPYSEGWIYVIEPSNWVKEIQFLSMADKYKNWLNNEFARLKDFLSNIVLPAKANYAYAVLQDGGEIRESLLEDFGPEVWEDFQTGFIDKSR